MIFEIWERAKKGDRRIPCENPSKDFVLHQALLRHRRKKKCNTHDRVLQLCHRSNSYSKTESYISN